MSYGTITITNTATRVLTANAGRYSLILLNNGSGTCWVGEDSSVTAGTGANAGTLLVEQATLTEDSGGHPMYQGDIWAINDTDVASAVSFWERTR